MKKIFLFIFVIMLSIVMKAQFITASNTDALTNAAGIENTGNAVEEFWYQPFGMVVGDMKVSVCDGSNASLVWTLAPNSGAPGGMLFTSWSLLFSSVLSISVEDPDVDLGEKGQTAMVVCTSGGSIVLFTCRFDIAQNGFHLVSGPTVIGQGENPNLNVYSYDGTVFYTIITWQDGNSIMACKSGGTASNFSNPIVINAQNTGNTFAKPDVTIKGSGINTATGLVGPMLASFTYIESSQTDGHNLVVQQELVTDIINNTLAYNFISLGLQWLIDDEYGYPRIASPWSTSPPFTGNFYDFSVVVDHITPIGEFLIESVTSNGGVLSSINSFPFPLNSRDITNFPINPVPPQYDISFSLNANPAIDYCGDNIVVAWQYFDDVRNIPAGASTFEILQRKLDLSGVPVLPSYSIVNFNNSGEQEYVSVAGRYSTQSKVLYTFSSTLNSSLAEKYSHIGNISLRLPREIYVGIYPNPFNNVLQINLEEDDDSHVKIYNINSRLVYEFHSNSHSFNLDLNFLPQGLYLLKIQNANGIQTRKIEKL